MRKKRPITKYTWSLWSSLQYFDTQEHTCKRYTHQYIARGDHANCIRTNKWGGKGRSKTICYNKLLKTKANIEKWFWSLTNIKVANKYAKIHHDRAQFFVFRSYTMHELRNQNVSIGKFLSTEFCARSRPKKPTKTYNKGICRLS